MAEDWVQGRGRGKGDSPRARPRRATRLPGREALGHSVGMEFLNFLLIAGAAWLVWRRPERERLAFGLLVASCVLMALLFLLGTHTSLVPGVNL